MKTLNPKHIEAIFERVNTCPYFTLLSMSIASLAPGQSRLQIHVQEKHLQPYGLVHGGVYASLVDAAAFWAVYSGMEGTHGLTTVEMKINYLAPASSGVFTALGKTIKTGKTICLGEATVTDEKERMLAHGTVTLMVLPSLALEGQSQFPPKFLE